MFNTQHILDTKEGDKSGNNKNKKRASHRERRVKQI